MCPASKTKLELKSKNAITIDINKDEALENRKDDAEKPLYLKRL